MTDPLRTAEEALTPFANVAAHRNPDDLCGYIFRGRDHHRAASALAQIRAARAEPHIIDTGTAKPDATMFDTEVDSARAAVPADRPYAWAKAWRDEAGVLVVDFLYGDDQPFGDGWFPLYVRPQATVPADREALARKLNEIANIEQSEVKRQAMREAAAIIRTPSPAEEVEAMAKRLEEANEHFRYELGTFDDLNVIRDAIALLRRSAPSSEWRPIETAPKDGTYVLGGRRPSRNRLPVYVCHWKDGWVSVPGGTHNAPTHWQPLPAAPSSAQAGEDVG